MPLIGASVLQKGTTNGVVTDIDGNYQLQIQGKDAMLRFSYIGMQPQEFKVNAQTNVLDVTLVDNTEMVDEVVVVAYGVRKKGTIAGSVSTVKSEKLENVPAAGFDQALQGQTRDLWLYPVRVNPVQPPRSKFVEQTPSTQALPLCLYWWEYLFPVQISIQSVRATSNPFLY